MLLSPTLLSSHYCRFPDYHHFPTLYLPEWEKKIPKLESGFNGFDIYLRKTWETNQVCKYFVFKFVIFVCTGETRDKTTDISISLHYNQNQAGGIGYQRTPA